MLPDLRGMKCLPAARQMTNSEFKLTFMTCKSARAPSLYTCTYLIPIMIGDVDRVTTLQHPAVVDEDVQMIHHLQCALHNFLGVFPDGQIAWDDVHLASKL